MKKAFAILTLLVIPVASTLALAQSSALAVASVCLQATSQVRVRLTSFEYGPSSEETLIQIFESPSTSFDRNSYENIKTIAKSKSTSYSNLLILGQNFLGPEIASLNIMDENSIAEAIHIEIANGNGHFLVILKKEPDSCGVASVDPIIEAVTNSLTPLKPPTAADVKHPNIRMEDEEDGDVSQMSPVNPEAPAKFFFRMPVADNYKPANPLKPLRGHGFGGRLLNSLGASRELIDFKTATGPLGFGSDGKIIVGNKSMRVFRPSTTNDLWRIWNLHIGTDLDIPEGTPVVAIYSGKIFSFGDLGCPGNTLVVQHQIPGSPRFVYASYKHLKSFGKSVVGQNVNAGDVIGYSGATGYHMNLAHGKVGCVAGAHLHFEIRVARNDEQDVMLANIDPQAQLPKISHATSKNKRGKSTSKNIVRNLPARLISIEAMTSAVNPADYIEQLDLTCRMAKEIEIKNAISLTAIHPGWLGPMTSGICSQRTEADLVKEFAELPQAYKLTSAEEISKIFPHTAVQPSTKKAGKVKSRSLRRR